MKLIKLVLNNFKGVRDFTFSPAGENASIFGTNETGKTTINDAVLWLLFNKDTLNQSAFDIKTLDENNSPIPKIDHSVEGVFFIDNEQVTLKKIYREDYTKKRGEAKKTLTGHKTAYEIDGVSVSQSQFQKQVKHICDEKVFRLLTSPTYFNEVLKPMERREMLQVVCGTPDLDLLIAKNPDFAPIQDIIKTGVDIENHVKKLKARRIVINEKLDEIPIRVDQINADMPAGTEKRAELLTEQIINLQGQISIKQKDAILAKEGGESSRLTIAINEYTAQLSSIETKHNEKQAEIAKTKRLYISGLEGDLQGEIDNSKSCHDIIEEDTEKIVELECANSALRREYDIIFESEQAKNENNCPQCGFDLTDEKTHQELTALFNEDKARKLAENQRQGRANAATMKILQNGIKKLKKDNLDRPEKIAKIKAMLEVDAKTTAPPEAVQLVEYQEIVVKRAELQEQLTKEQEGADNTAQVDRLNNEVAALEEQVKELQADVVVIEQRQTLQDSLKKLAESEQKHVQEYEGIEAELYLIERFETAKALIFEEKINQHFDIVTFKLFEKQINEGMKPVCVCLKDGVPYRSMNNAGRVQSGLDIIQTLSRHHEFFPMIFIDNRESVVDLPEMNAQIINLIVSKQDKVLRVEKI